MSSVRSSDTGGVPAFSIGGRMVKQRERLLGMTEEERRWRAQFLKDQILDPDEPRFSPEYYRATTNIFRRIFRFPMQMLYNTLKPVVGHDRACTIRYVTGRYILLSLCVLSGCYYFTYNKQNWTSEKGWMVIPIRGAILPGDPGYPHVYKLKNYEYHDLEFSKSHFFKG